MTSAYAVTGGAGFIGSHIVEALVADGHRVRVVDDLSTGRRENLAALDGRIEVLTGSILDEALLERAFAGVAGVFHQAAMPSVPRSIADPAASHEVNATGTLRVLLAARRAGAKVVYAGPSSVYGDSLVLPKSEDMTPAPKSPYAAQKLMGEHYCTVFAHVHGLRTVTLRYFNVFGPRQRADSPYSGVIAKFCLQGLAGAPCVVDGDGQQSRDFTYVADVVRGNLLAMEGDVPPGSVLNLAGGGRITLLELLAALEAILGRPIERRFAPPRPGDVKHSQAAVERARQALGFRAEVAFRAGLERTLAWYMESQRSDTSIRSRT
jgi:UDP-glucose 4-epimerase